MGFFQKNINLFLMIVIIISVVAYAGSTVYYQETFQNVTSESHSIKTMYSSCQANLENTNEQLQRTQDILNSTERDIQKYDTLYETQTSTLTTTQSELDTAEKDLASYTSLYTQEKKRAEDLSDEVTRVTNLKNELSSENNALRLQVATLQTKWDNCKDDLNTCEDANP